MKKVVISTDGSAEPNPGRGGYAAVLRFGKAYREISGHEPFATNNRMEMLAIVEAMRVLREPCRVHIRSDSKTAISWCQPGIVQSIGRKPKRAAKLAHVLPLIVEFSAISSRHVVTFEWLRGHNGDPDNERCDALAAQAIAGTTVDQRGLADLLAHTSATA